MTCCSWLSFGFSLASNLSGVVRFPRTAISSLFPMTIIAVLVLTFISPVAGSSIAPVVNSTLAQLGIFNSTSVALQAFGISNASTDTYFIDSVCSCTIVCNSKYMRNLREITPIQVKGLTGYKTYDLVGDMHFPLTTDDNSTIKILEVENVLFDPSGDINLIDSNDINKTDWDVNLSANPSRSGLYYYPPGSTVPAAR
eukprot:3375447-Rhodomonas_salina.1